jgi:transcription termination factor Rho
MIEEGCSATGTIEEGCSATGMIEEGCSVTGNNEIDQKRRINKRGEQPRMQSRNSTVDGEGAEWQEIGQSSSLQARRPDGLCAPPDS